MNECNLLKLTTYIREYLFLTTNELLFINNHVFEKLLKTPHIKTTLKTLSLLFLSFLSLSSPLSPPISLSPTSLSPSACPCSVTVGVIERRGPFGVHDSAGGVLARPCALLLREWGGGAIVELCIAAVRSPSSLHRYRSFTFVATVRSPGLRPSEIPSSGDVICKKGNQKNPNC